MYYKVLKSLKQYNRKTK